MKQLIEKYGYCIIPKNTYLYRASDNIYDNTMHFGLHYSVAGAMSFKTKSKDIHIYRTKKEITILFLIDSIRRHNHCISSLPFLCNDILKTSFTEKDDLKAKEFCYENFSSLIEPHKITGWLTSLENNKYIEICLLDKNLNQQNLEIVSSLKYINTIHQTIIKTV